MNLPPVLKAGSSGILLLAKLFGKKLFLNIQNEFRKYMFKDDVVCNNKFHVWVRILFKT